MERSGANGETAVTAKRPPWQAAHLPLTRSPRAKPLRQLQAVASAMVQRPVMAVVESWRTTDEHVMAE